MLRTSIARGIAISLATGIAATSALAGSAQAATTDDPAKVGMFGVQDPTYDGAYRQGLSVLALSAAGTSVPASAGQWLLEQQCPDGGYMGFRIDDACTPDPTLFTGEDSNVTALAVMALANLGEDSAATTGVGFLATLQVGGGFEFQSGFGADPNSTGLSILALLATGNDPSTFNGQNAYAGLDALQADCSADPLDVGGYVAPFSGQADLFATVQAIPARAAATLPIAPPASFAATVPDISCPGAFADPALAAADWLEDQPLSSFDNVTKRAFAVLSFAAVGAGETKAREIFAAMSADLATATVEGGGLFPGAAAQYILAAIALGEDPNFGSADLVNALAASVLAAEAAPSPSPTPTPAATTAAVQPAAVSGELADSGLPEAVADQVLVGAALLVIGAALTVATRRRDTQR